MSTATTDDDRAKPEVDQTWTWGPLLCHVIAVTRAYVHLEVTDGNGSWIKRQRLPLSAKFELMW